MGTSSNKTMTSKKITTQHNPMALALVITVVIIAGCCIITGTDAINQPSVDEEMSRLLGKCDIQSDEFDYCMKDVCNDLRAYFQTGIPQYHVKPFDPHHASFVELRRGNQNGLGFKLILRNVSEYGWTQSEVTKFHTDFDQKRIIYSQYFPEKSLNGWYEFSGILLGTPLKRSGFWNMTLYDYSQTTSVRRLGEPGSLLKVHVEVDRIGGMKMHVGDILAPGRDLDNVINNAWPLGLPFIQPMINELVSTAFTDIFNESFRHFPLERFIR
ncbi:juvenile hormone binding protein 16 [Haematobia irritans]|uniref:juvenile hormone binding protein 16 n=1 Tax=Haematobia irritans TaxID=7368 RepID=UPI003F4F3F91